jgi:type II secretory pathway component GspD/PulD (secretin)
MNGAVRAQQPRTRPGAEPTFLFEMRGKSWAAIFEWLTDKTGLPFLSSNAAPTGTFNVIVKPGRRYTLGEVIDLINDGLLPNKYVLVRRPASFSLVPADEKLPRHLVPPVRLEDLPGRGDSEVVEIVLPLKALMAEDYAGQVKKMLGPFGEVLALKQGNRLVLQGTAGTLRFILATTRDIEEELRATASVAEVVPLVQLEAVRAAESLRTMYPASKSAGPYIEPDPTRNALLVKGTAEQVRDVKQTIRSLDGAAGNLRVIILPQGSGATAAEALRLLLQKMTDNPVRVVAPADPGRSP